MKKILGLLFLGSITLFANEIGHSRVDLTMTWVGFAVLIIFVVGYYFIAAEDRYELDKSHPALFIGTFSFVLVGGYYYAHGYNLGILDKELISLTLEISEIFFFLFVAMTYIESLITMGVFDRLKYNLVSKGYTYRKLFWVTGLLAFFISPVADNLTTALILSTVLITIDKNKKDFLIPGAINIVVAANAGGAWSPFGDITTLMTWTSGKAQFSDFFYVFPAAVLGYFCTAYLLSRFVPKTAPHFDVKTEKKPMPMKGAKVVIIMGVITIVSAVLVHQLLGMPAMWGMMFGLALLKLYAYRLKKVHNSEFDIFKSMENIEYNTLLFFFGILAAVGCLFFVGWLTLAAGVYNPDVLGPTISNVLVGFVSSIIDNVPVMSAVLQADPKMGLDQWMLVTLTAGVGGSLISFGSAAGVGVMGKLKGIYTFASHMKYAWTVLIGYLVSVGVWYLQYEVFGVEHNLSKVLGF